MSRHTPLVVVACGLVVWVLRPGMVRPPGPRTGGDVAVTVLPVAVDSRNGAANRDNPVANGYGSISGRVVLAGKIPVLPGLVRAGDNRIKPDDRATCAREDIPDESLVVDVKTKGIANVFVYLPKATRGIHPRLQKSEQRQVGCEIQACRYRPRALFARTDQAVVVRVQDDVPHNLHDRPLRTVRFGETIQPLLNQQREMKLRYLRPEPVPFPVVCDLHSWMRASWLILDHPYAAITDAQGKFTIADLPAGAYEFRVWHEAGGEIQDALQAVVKADQTTDLGEIKVPVARFENDTRRRQ
jgi:hypothetical protein